ncbi:uncharacterized protein BJ212DRAFT_1375527 [Suillus subaureus]|uniref:Uncharacterized protein n=1 Tax=Suillus subaureus TaxID=48587 RepID=A0A9P7JA84_9AGAM|nr:uncharacterized protein BJ212DRAFT_1375527 [Suillus subaureus]KAG1811201.1 hypothetical protein BJ212DRAFT_1375527 [Suillus subaureus]
MIHLDRNRNEIDSEQNSNLILQGDHSATFNWVTDISHNDEHHNYFQNSLSDLNNNHPEGQTIHPIQLQTDDKSSSLSPPPEYTSSPQIKRKSPPQEPVQEPEQEDDGDGSYSRQLTPLTDLSAVPDGDDSLDFEKKDDSTGEVEQEQNGDLNSAQDNQDNRWSEKRTINGTSSPVRSIPNSPTRHPIPLPVPGPSHRLGPSAGPSHSRRPSREIVSISQLPSPNLPPAKLSDPSAKDPKVDRILEINSELFKVCMEFQTRGVPQTDARFSHFSNRLQVNLAWLTVAADPHRCNDPRLVLPAMDAPSPVEFISMDRIHHLYADLPTIFAKELARRQPASGAQYSPTSSALLNGPLKRSRPDDMADLMNKRRDIGETKQHSMQPPTIPSISISGAGQRTSPTSTFPPPIHPNMSLASAPAIPQSPRTSSPMPPPSSTPSLPFGATEASIAATTRARAREMQIHQAREQLRAAQMQQQMQSARQISPPDSSPRIPQNSGPGAPQHPHTSYSHNAAAMQILQNPSHPLMTYLVSQIPNFTSLPLPQQVQKLTNFHNILQQKQQQNPSNQQQRPPMPGQMPGLGQNPSMSPMPNVPMQSSGPSPVSPLGQQSPVSSQPQQQMSAQPQQTGMYPFSNQGHNCTQRRPPYSSPQFLTTNAGQHERYEPQPATAAHAHAAANAEFKREHEHERSEPHEPAAGVCDAATTTAAASWDAQGGPSQGGSPMSAPANDAFPALRSNSTIPGIARSGRSPSESVHSPMTPRAPSRLSSQPPIQPEDYQRAMTQQPQPGMMGTQQNAGSFHPQMQYHQWPNGQQQQQQQHQQQQQQQQQQQLSLGGQMNGFGMNPQGGAVAANGPYGGSISPSAGPNWQQQSMNGYYPQSNQRPPNIPMQQNISPIGGDTSTGEYDIFNWNGP